MVNLGKGGILFIASVGAYGIGPYMANYSASKAYILSLGESLHYEMKDKGGRHHCSSARSHGYSYASGNRI